MKRGEKIEIERLTNGYYRIHVPARNIVMVGDAASTAISLIHAVFSDEAQEIPDAKDR